MTHQVQSVPLKTSLSSTTARATLALFAGGRWLSTKLTLAGAAGSVALGFTSPAGAAATTSDSEANRSSEAIGFTQRLGAVRHDMASKGLTAEDVSPLKSTQHYAWYNWHSWPSTAVAGVRG